MRYTQLDNRSFHLLGIKELQHGSKYEKRSGGQNDWRKEFEEWRDQGMISLVLRSPAIEAEGVTAKIDSGKWKGTVGAVVDCSGGSIAQ